MIVGYLLIMGTLAIGLRVVQRSGKAAVGSAPGAGKTAGADEPAGAGNRARANQVTGAAAATGADSVSGGRQLTGPPAGNVTGRTRLRTLARPDPGWRRFVIHYLGTAVGGYLLLMVVIIGYYFGISPVAGNFVHSAFTGCALLIGLATPVFIALSWLVERKGWRI
jgi:hypothetical protein